MVLKGRVLGGLGDFNNLNIFRFRQFHMASGELSVEPIPNNNWSTYDRVLLVTKKSRLARVGKIRPADNGTDELKIIPFDPIDPGWDPIFLEALRREKEELYMRFLPATDDLEQQLLIELSVQSDWGSDLVRPDNHNPGHRDDKPVDELPVLEVDSTGNVDPATLFAWFNAANGQIQAQPGLSFGEVAGSLPDGLEVDHVHYNPGYIGYNQGVFPNIVDVRVVSNRGGFMIDIEAEANRGARGKFIRRSPEKEAVESVEEKGLPNFIRAVINGQEPTKRMVLSLIGHDLGTVVVDNMEVDSIKRVCKKGKKLYRIFLKPEEKGGNLNRRVNAGSYGKCSLWIVWRNMRPIILG
jgi:hypothetical protein